MNWLIELTKELRPFAGKKCLLAVSGGLDSMSLFHMFLHLRQHFDFQFSVAYYHHGPSPSAEQLSFRFKAWSLVRQECLDHKVSFFSNFNGDQENFISVFGKSLLSEEEMREARYAYLYKVLETERLDNLVLAHHQEDLLETRLLRLLRGTGPEGLQAMSLEQEKLLRPLLKVSRKQLEDFLGQRKGRFLEDPSNKDSQYLRNWLRESWLKDLENRLPGATNSLHRSLDLLVSSLGQSEGLDSFLDGKNLIISQLLCLSLEERRRIVANYMRSQGCRNYGLSHINEVLKRLDREEKSHTFKLLGRCWKVDAGRMSLS